ncbi:MAG: ABC transporter permease subunit [bacterium]
MSWNLFIKELRDHLKGSVILSAGVALYVVFSLNIYSAMTKNIEKVTDLYSAIPETMRIAFNLDLNKWSNILGFYVTYFIYYVPIVVGCYAIIVAMKSISKEEQNRTAEFLLSRPLSRDQIVASKLLSLLVHLLGINVIVYLVALISCNLFAKGNFDIAALTILHTYGFLVCILFGVLGFFITVIMKRAKAVIGIGIGIVLGAYLFDMMFRISDRWPALLYFTPFKYMNLEVLAPDYGFDLWRLMVLFGISGGLIFLSFLFYRKKNILI